MKEGDIQTSITDYLTAKGHYWKRVNSGKVLVKKGPYQHWLQLAPEGTPDIDGFQKGTGKYFAIEVKRPKYIDAAGKVWPKTYTTKVQKEVIKRINDLGGLAFEARSIDDVIMEGL